MKKDNSIGTSQATDANPSPHTEIMQDSKTGQDIYSIVPVENISDIK